MSYISDYFDNFYQAEKTDPKKTPFLTSNTPGEFSELEKLKSDEKWKLHTSVTGEKSVQQHEKSKNSSDLIHRPSHYTWKGGMECKDLITEMVRGLDPVEGYYLGNIIKYYYRFPVKNGLQDVEKALEYGRLLRDYEAKKKSWTEKAGKREPSRGAD